MYEYSYIFLFLEIKWHVSHDSGYLVYWFFITYLIKSQINPNFIFFMHLIPYGQFFFVTIMGGNLWDVWFGSHENLLHDMMIRLFQGSVLKGRWFWCIESFSSVTWYLNFMIIPWIISGFRSIFNSCFMMICSLSSLIWLVILSSGRTKVMPDVT